MQISEVAKLRQRIADEYVSAKNGMTGLAYGTSRHDFITQHLENMRKCQEQLEAIVGCESAMKIVAETLQPL